MLTRKKIGWPNNTQCTAAFPTVNKPDHYGTMEMTKLYSQNSTTTTRLLDNHYKTPRQLRSRSINILQNSATVLILSQRAFVTSHQQCAIVFDKLSFPIYLQPLVHLKQGLNLLCTVVPSCSDTWLSPSCDSSLLQWMYLNVYKPYNK